MATRLSEATLSRAIDHVIRFGDTDVFPHLIENVFLHEQKSIVIESLSKLDLDTFSPIQAVETIAPKSRLGFRTVHQLHYLDSLLFTAAVIEIGGELEKLKLPASGFGPFAYRFDPTGAESLFAQEHTYKSWLDRQREILATGDYAHVVLTDIADFYARLYLHRVENTLDVATANKGVKRFIETTLATIPRDSGGM